MSLFNECKNEKRESLILKLYYWKNWNVEYDEIITNLFLINLISL